jgi:hypothetical protein
MSEVCATKAYRKSDILTVIDNNFGLVAPDIVEHVHHNLDSLVPYQFIIFLEMEIRIGR